MALRRRKKTNNPIALLLIVAVALLLGRLYQPEPAAPAKSDFSGKCTAVTDGDTIRVLHAGQEERVRLYGIDCPEKHQAYYSAASKFTSKLAFGKTVQVRWHGRDRYGRVLGRVILADGRDLNTEIVKVGMGWWYRQFAPRDAGLEAAEREARSARRGLWADQRPTPPWEFRRKN